MSFLAPAIGCACAAALSALAAAQSALPEPTGFDRHPFIGRWTDDGDCDRVTLLGEDGIFVAPNGARGDWGVHGSTLKLSGPGGIVTWTVVFDDPDRMVLTSPDGTRSTSTRCLATIPAETA